jgi:hypothetical protein
MATENEGQVEFEVEGDGSIDIEIVDDRPDADKNATPLKADPSDIPDDEIKLYSENVKKRIQHLKHGYHDERRAKEEAQREREAAIVYAKQIADENAKLKEKLTTGESTLIKTMQFATEKELGEAEREFKEALESQDSDRILKAQKALNAAMFKADRVKAFKPQQQLPAPQTPVYNPPQDTPIDRRAESWKGQNPWFGQSGQPGVDDEMTFFAMGLHKKLTRERGDQYALTDEYYERINSRMREKFPEYFGIQDEPKEDIKRPASVVAPATRSSPPKKLKLTQSEANTAKRLGVPLKDYAEQVAKLRMEGKI